MSKPTIDISIIIVNYCGAGYLKECLDALFASQTQYQFEVIVVDNASSDDSITILKKYTQPITIIENQTNNGFAKANNQGISVAKGRYLFMLNNDTHVATDALQAMIEFYDAHPQIGALSPQLLNRDASPQIAGSILGRRYYKTLLPKSVKFISGAAFLIKTEFMKELGGWDENFFFYNEDSDLCKRIIKAGHEIIYLPEAKVVHFGGEATKTRRAASIIEGYRGGLYLCLKHYGRLVFILYRIVLFFDLIPRMIWNLLLSRKPARREQLKAYLHIASMALTGRIANQ